MDEYQQSLTSLNNLPKVTHLASDMGKAETQTQAAWKPRSEALHYGIYQLGVLPLSRATGAIRSG